MTSNNDSNDSPDLIEGDNFESIDDSTIFNRSNLTLNVGTINLSGLNLDANAIETVSYTHLTLPTICSV